MLWHITKREIYDHLTSLRFALAVGIITLLMVLNGLIFVGSDYKGRLSEYSQNTAGVADRVKAICGHLNELATQGPGGFYKRPSSLAFCANDQEDSLPVRIGAQGLGTWMWGGDKPERIYRFDFPWKLGYPQDAYQKNSMLQSFTALDWSFIVGVVMSFVTILFTFDAISGEREQGTLKLTMSNSVPRDVVLLGKFFGAFIAVAVPLLMGMILSLLIVSVSGSVSLDGNDWKRIGLVAIISFIYISLFISLGLFVSSRMRHSSTSLLVLLFIWVVLVVLIPNTLGSVVSTLRKVPSQSEFQQQWKAMSESFNKSEDELFKYGSPTQPNPSPKAIELWADYVTSMSESNTRLDDEHLDAQFAQVQLARRILRSASPTTIYNYVMESLAGTGFGRHSKFVDAARRYRGQFVDFIKSADRADSKSLHFYYLKEGLSERPVTYEDIPRFVEPTNLITTLRDDLINMGLLLLLSVMLFFASYISFLRCDVR